MLPVGLIQLTLAQMISAQSEPSNPGVPPPAPSLPIAGNISPQTTVGTSYGASSHGSIYTVNYGTIVTSVVYPAPTAIWYGATDGDNEEEFFATPSGGSLYRINPTTATVTAVGSYGGVEIKELAYNEDKGILYGTDYYKLYTIDTSTGIPSEVGSMIDDGNPPGGFWAMDYHDKFDKLFAVSQNTKILYEVNITDGSLTPVGSTNADRITDIWYDLTTETLYAITNSNEKHYTLNTSSGEATLLEEFLDSHYSILGLGNVSYEPNTLLYALANTEGGNAPMNLYTLDKKTGSSTLIAETDTVGLRGLAIDSTSGKFYSAYGSWRNTDKRGIVEIDPVTGAVTDIGGTKAFVALTFDSVGQLYGAENSGGPAQPGKIYKINTAAGTETFLGIMTAQDNTYGPGLAHDSSAGTLYFKGWEGQLSAVDTTTGGETLTGRITLPWTSSHSFDFDEDGNAYYHQHPCGDESKCGDGLAFGYASDIFNAINIGFTGLKVWGMAIRLSGSKCQGDVNMDGHTDYADIHELQNLMSGGCDDIAMLMSECSDCDNDGRLTLLDITCINKVILNNCEPGDANTDGFITRSDICKTLEMIRGREYSTCADCYKDGRVNSADFLCVADKLKNETCNTAGDANMDGKINTIDKHEFNLLRSTCDYDAIPECADCNEDGFFTSRDKACHNVIMKENCKPGDANADGFVTPSDLCRTREMVSGTEYSTCADCNKDGYITSSDLFCVKGVLNGSNKSVNMIPVYLQLLLNGK